MSITINSKLSRNGQRKWYTFDFGKGRGQRKAAGVFTYVHPRDKIEKRHNDEALALLDTQKSEVTLECQSSGTSFIPSHRFRENFLDYYAEFVSNNVRGGNRHLESSLEKFQVFIKRLTFLRTLSLQMFASALTGIYWISILGKHQRIISDPLKESLKALPGTAIFESILPRM